MHPLCAHRGQNGYPLTGPTQLAGSPVSSSLNWGDDTYLLELP